MFSLVKFVKDNSIEAISSSWISGDTCEYPQKNVSKLIASNSKPQSSWAKYAITVAFTSDCLEECRQKRAIYEDKSNLESSSDEETGRRCKRSNQQIPQSEFVLETLNAHLFENSLELANDPISSSVFTGLPLIEFPTPSPTAPNCSALDHISSPRSTPIETFCVYRAVARISGLTPTKFGVETTIKAWLRNSPAKIKETNV
ncbi:unnamed protein product [Allacma fusca]|uniref:Uncharacterized protein n=1 Tax=Allacma fusca TaxID=39272 RepID=A0A8J2P3V6_9HEXA|nr:unnamed protein product [Allacma fusca]